MNKSFLYVGLMVVVFILLSVVLLVNGITINKLSFWTILLIAETIQYVSMSYGRMSQESHK
jgi:hypothetical protein